MNTLDRLLLMMKMLRENYDSELRQQRFRMSVRNRSLTPEEIKSCEMEAKKVVCEIGISMNQFRRRYSKTIENEAIHQAINLGIERELVQWSQPKRYDAEKGSEGRFIILTEKGFEYIFQEGVELVMTMTHSLYIPKPGE
jgi:hypothetical protein